jgi:hypothetical protein
MIRNTTKMLLIACAVLFASSAIFAQTQQPAATQSAKVETGKAPNPAELYSEADRPEDNYLERFHALEVCDRLITENLDRIYTLNVITTNFKSQHSDWDADYQNVYKGYKEAVDLYYRRNIIYARVRLEENKSAINKFYLKIAKAYKDDTLGLLSKCADTLLELSLGTGDSKANANPADTTVKRSSPEINKALFINKMRIRIAYSEMDNATTSESTGVPHVAIFHYRVAKGYAIRILEDLDVNNRGKYDLHKADNLNRIMTARKTVSNPNQPAATN